MIKRTAFWFGLSAYFLTFLYYEGPHWIAYNPVLYHTLPYWMCVFTIDGMAVQGVLLVIGPINAGLYAVLGAGFGWVLRTWLRLGAPPPSGEATGA